VTENDDRKRDGGLAGLFHTHTGPIHTHTGPIHTLAGLFLARNERKAAFFTSVVKLAGQSARSDQSAYLVHPATLELPSLETKLISGLSLLVTSAKTVVTIAAVAHTSLHPSLSSSGNDAARGKCTSQGAYVCTTERATTPVARLSRDENSVESTAANMNSVHTEVISFHAVGSKPLDSHWGERRSFPTANNSTIPISDTLERRQRGQKAEGAGRGVALLPYSCFIYTCFIILASVFLLCFCSFVFYLLLHY
jgi:hypothetical protein